MIMPERFSGAWLRLQKSIMGDKPEKTPQTLPDPGLAEPVPVGIFDSGIGGLSVLKHLKQQIPYQPFYYLADEAHVPYGPRSMDDIRTFSLAISRYLIAKGCRVIVVACNTASAAALQDLRARFTDVAFVGMEPALKPAVRQTRSGIVGILATPATFNGGLYCTLAERFGQEVCILKNTCPGLVEEIEAGNAQGETARSILQAAIQPMIAQGADTLVLGCTHYPLALNVIQEVAGPHIEIIDPAPAVARQTARVLEQNGWLAHEGMGSVQLITTGAKDDLQQTLFNLLSLIVPITRAYWQRNVLMDHLSDSGIVQNDEETATDE